MDDVSLATAKARLSELVAQVVLGDTVRITRGGKPAVQLTAIERPRKPIDVAALRHLTATMPHQTESGVDFVRHMRDSDRY